MNFAPIIQNQDRGCEHPGSWTSCTNSQEEQNRPTQKAPHNFFASQILSGGRVMQNFGFSLGALYQQSTDPVKGSD
jgi:hypothetical protein